MSIKRKAGRPTGSTTPVWRNEAAIKVAVYRFLMNYKHQEATKSGCARYMDVSRTTAIKWWDTIRWTQEDLKNLTTIREEWNDDIDDEDNVTRLAEEYDLEADYIRVIVDVLDMLYDSNYSKYWNMQL